MRFESPWFLLLLLLVPLWGWWTLRRARTRFVQFSEVRFFEGLTNTSWWAHPAFLPTFRGLALTLAILALARPQTGRTFSEVVTQGVDIVLSVDTSGSMQALDLKWNGQNVTRLDVVKNVLQDFIKQRQSDRVGMVVFGEEAFTQAPLTSDLNLLSGFLDQMFIGMAGDATAIGSAIAVSTKRLKDLKAKSKIIILLTDGESNAGKLDPLQAASAAKDLGIKIYTIGVGSNGPAPFQVDGFFGKQTVYQQVSLDEVLLQKIAETTNGRYFRATNTQELQEIYQTIDALEKTEAKIKEFHEYEEHFALFLWPALGLFLLEFILLQTRLRRLP